MTSALANFCHLERRRQPESKDPYPACATYADAEAFSPFADTTDNASKLG